MPAHPASPALAAEIDPALSVDTILRRWPSSAGPLNSFGIDTCCGGALSLATAAAAAGAPLAELLAAVAAAAGRDA
jgi:regulator of cell morphogenesis and NO signaling